MPEPSDISATVARHDAEIAAIGRDVTSIKATVAAFGSKLDEAVSTIAASGGRQDRLSIPTLIGVGGLLIAAAALGLPMIDDIRKDSETNYTRNEQRIERLEDAHGLEVARNNRIEHTLGGLEAIHELYLAGKLRLETP